MITKQFIKSILAASIATTKDTTRQHLNHVRLEVLRDYLEIVATNGHWLAHVTLPVCHAENLIPNEVYHFNGEAIKSLKVELKLAPIHAENIDINLSRYNSPGVKYPDWRVITENKNTSPKHTPTIGLSGEYLNDIIKFYKQLGVKHTTLKISIVDVISPVTIKSNTQDLGFDACAILMPVRL